MSDKMNELIAVSAETLHKWHHDNGLVLDQTQLRTVVSPYRISPIGAHVDHQGGAVLGRTIDQYTVMAYVVADSAEISFHVPTLNPSTYTFTPDDPMPESGWGRYAHAAAKALHRHQALQRGIRGNVIGTLLGAGLSSSASVILAYLHALADANGIVLTSAEYVELARQVENEFLGLNNGIQDQTAISFGNAKALLHMNNVERIVTPIADAGNVDKVCFLLAYSGFSRELLGSGFNNRVAECREAAALLHAGATVLGDVPMELRNDDRLAALPDHLARRARHYFGEVARVEAGRAAWAAGDWVDFGRNMNQSCYSSINYYESGSQPLVDLHTIASGIDGVYGSRFSGGGYGGCLIMLVERAKADAIGEAVLSSYLDIYPEKSKIAKVFVAGFEAGVRVQG